LGEENDMRLPREETAENRRGGPSKKDNEKGYGARGRLISKKGAKHTSYIRL